MLFSNADFSSVLFKSFFEVRKRGMFLVSYATCACLKTSDFILIYVHFPESFNVSTYSFCNSCCRFVHFCSKYLFYYAQFTKSLLMSIRYFTKLVCHTASILLMKYTWSKEIKNSKFPFPSFNQWYARRWRWYLAFFQTENGKMWLILIRFICQLDLYFKGTCAQYVQSK